MRRITWLVLSSSFALAACQGAGPDSASSTPVSGGGGSGSGSSATDAYSQFTNPVDAKTYSGVGGEQVYTYTTDGRNCCNQQGQVYAGNASTVRSSNISLAYDPRSATFTLTINDPASGAATSTNFQDPASRTNFGGSVEPQWGVPNLNGLTGPAAAYNNPNIQYLQAGDGNPLSPYSSSGSGFIDPGTNTTPPNGSTGSSYASTTLFYEKPGSTTKYVSLAGYVRNALSYSTIASGTSTAIQDSWHLERGAFAYGVLTDNGAVPVTGTGTYTGEMLATMVYNPTLDGANGTVLPTFFQWLTGKSTVNVDFGKSTVNLALQGAVLNPQTDRFTSPTSAWIPAGSTFSGNGSATIDLVNKGGFTGSFAGGNFAFTAPTGQTFGDGKSTTANVNVAGSSINGGFYGPAAQEVGGGFRVVGGIPDQRVDILGAFTGKKP